MRTLPVLSLVTAAIVVGFVAWRGNDSVPSRPPDPVPVPPTAPAGAPPANPDLVAAQTALKEADSAAGPAQARALETAIRRFDALLEKDPDDIELHFQRGIAATMARDQAAAAAHLARLATLSTLKERDARFVYLQAIGILAFDPSKPDKAVRLLRMLRSEVPTFMAEPVRIALHRALLQASVARSDPRLRDEAVRFAEEALALVRNDDRLRPMTQRLLARSYTRAAQFHEAEEIWHELDAAAGGKDVDVVSGLANTLAMQDRFEDAAEAFTKVLALLATGALYRDAGVPEARLRRGNCYRLMGRLDAARADLEEYLRLHPDDHRAVHWIGMLWFDGYDDPDKALPFLERAYRAAPWCEVYGTVLLQVYEIRRPDPVKAASLRREMSDNAEAYRAKMEALSRENRDGVSICR